jgi:tRNA threonylcarbamoyladenosine biosynthesis protein TsaE
MALPTSTKRPQLIKSPDEMRAWGRRFSAVLKVGDVLALIGPLGAGKTTFVQGLAEGWGYKRGANSPTFALANEYKTPRGNVYHMDMYRLSEQELMQFPLEDYWGQGLCVIEWADRIRARWPADTIEVHFTALGESRRRLTVKRMPKGRRG